MRPALLSSICSDAPEATFAVEICFFQGGGGARKVRLAWGSARLASLALRQLSSQSSLVSTPPCPRHAPPRLPSTPRPPRRCFAPSPSQPPSRALLPTSSPLSVSRTAASQPVRFLPAQQNVTPDASGAGSWLASSRAGSGGARSIRPRRGRGEWGGRTRWRWRGMRWGECRGGCRDEVSCEGREGRDGADSRRAVARDSGACLSVTATS